MTTVTVPDSQALAERRAEGGLEVMQHYTQTKSVSVDLQEEPADWFGEA